MQIKFRLGLKTLFDGYLTASDFLCDGHVISRTIIEPNMLNSNNILCDGYVIGYPVLFDSHMIKATK
jgi:hypothetical protein